MDKGFGLGRPLRMPKYYSDQMLKEAMAERRKIKNQFLDSVTIDHTNKNAIQRFISESTLKISNWHIK